MENRGTSIRIAACALLVACAFVLLRGATARADDAHASAAQRVLDAIAAADDDRVREVARVADLDPWLVVDALHARDERAAARRFAAAVASGEAEALRAYVDGPPETEARKARRSLLAALERARAEAPDRVPLLLKAVPRRLDGVPSILLGAERAAHAYDVAAYDEVRKAAESLGWLSKAASLAAEAGLAAHARGDADTAVRLFRDWAALEARRGSLAGELRALENLGGLLELYGQFEQARDVYERGLAVADASGNDPAIATMARALGTASHILGESRDAIALLRRSSLLFRAAADVIEEATTLSELGTVWLDLGESEKALDVLRRARTLFANADDPKSAALVLGNIGAVHERRGELEEARRAYRAVLDVTKAHADAAGQATSHLNLGVVAEALGRSDEAVAHYKAALALYASVDLLAGVVAAHTNLGRACAASGDAEQARRHREQALTLSSRFGDPRSQAAAQAAMAEFELTAGNLDAAAAHARDALELYEGAGDVVGSASSLRLLGITAHRRARTKGDLEAAVRELVKAHELAREAGARDVAVRSLIALAAVRFDGEDYVEATRLARDAALEVPLLVRGQDEERAATGRREWTNAFRLGIEASLARDNAEDALWFVEAGRAGALLESLGGAEALRAHTLSGRLRRREAEARAAVRRALGVYQEARKSGVRKVLKPAKRDLKAAQQGLKDVIAEIQAEAKSATDTLYPEPSSLDEIQGALRGNEALVLYVVGDAMSRAFVVRKDGLRVVTLVGREAIERAVDALLPSDAPFVEPEAVPDVRALLVDPLELGDDVDRVLISPDGVVARVPFAVLVDRQTGYVPSGTTYDLLAEQRAVRGTGVLGLGDPDYEGHELSLMPLPGTKDEVEQIADVRFFGRAASEASLKKTLPKRRRWRAVHIACHGLIDPDQPMLSKLALSVDPENDGSLTVAEVIRLDAPADLATLSACDVGRGEIVTGEGVLGFARAFMLAGAPRVIVSLWRVDDQATRALMTALYERWNPKDGSSGMPLAQALREAQNEIRDISRWSHPQHWAAWTLWGLPDADADAREQISIDEASRRATTAAASGDGETLAALAARDDPDPWRVVNHLLSERKLGIALALAEASSSPDTEGLAAWVRSAPVVDRPWRSRVDRAAQLVAEGEGDEALALLSTDGLPGGVTGIRALWLVAETLRRSRGRASALEAVATYEEAARRGKELGWLGLAVRCYERAGQLSLQLGKPMRAVAAWQWMRTLHDRRMDERGVADASVNLGVALQGIGALDLAKKRHEEAFEILVGLGEARAATTARSNIVAVLIQKNAFAEALPIAEDVVHDATRLGLRRLAADATGNLGMILDGLERAAEARATYEQALELLGAVRDDLKLALVRGHLGSLLERQGQVEDALVQHRAALHVFEERGDVVGEANALTDVGAVHAALGENIAAGEAFRESLAIWSALGDPAGEARAWANLGYVAFARANARDAIDAHTHMLAAMRASGDPDGAATALASLASAHDLAGEYVQALARWREAINDAESREDPVSELGARLGRAQLSWSIGDREGARADVARARVVAASTGASADDVRWIDAVEASFVADPERANALRALRAALDDPQAAFDALVSLASHDLLVSMGGTERMVARAVPAALREALLESWARRDSAAAVGRDTTDADARVSDALAALHRERPDVAWLLAGPTVSLAEVQARLDEDESWHAAFSLDGQSYVLAVSREAARVAKAEEVDRPDGALIVSAVGAEPTGARRVPLLAFVHGAPRPGRSANVLVARNAAPAQDDLARRIYATPGRNRLVPVWPDEVRALLIEGATKASLRSASRAEKRWRVIVLDAPLSLHADRLDLSGLWLAPGEDGDGVLTGLDLVGADLRCDVLVLPHAEGGTSRTRAALLEAATMAGADAVLLGRAGAEPAVATRFLSAFHAALREGLTPGAATARAQAETGAEGWQLWSRRG